MDPIVIIDEDQRIVAFNAAAEAAFGWTRDETVGRPLDMLMPERFRDRHRAHVEAFARTGTTSRRMGTQADPRGLAPQRRGIPDRGVDLAIRRRGRETVHRHPARRHGARAHAGAACDERSAHARHPRVRDGRDHHRRREPERRALQYGGRNDVPDEPRGGDRRAALDVHSRALSRGACVARESLRRGSCKLAAHGRLAHCHGRAARRRRVPDRRCDLAPARRRSRVLYRDPARRERAREGARRPAPVQARAAGARRRGGSHPRAGEEPRSRASCTTSSARPSR